MANKQTLTDMTGKHLKVENNSNNNKIKHQVKPNKEFITGLYHLVCMYSTSQKFGDTFSFKILLSCIIFYTEDIETIHIGDYVVDTKHVKKEKKCFIF